MNFYCQGCAPLFGYENTQWGLKEAPRSHLWDSGLRRPVCPKGSTAVSRSQKLGRGNSELLLLFALGWILTCLARAHRGTQEPLVRVMGLRRPLPWKDSNAVSSSWPLGRVKTQFLLQGPFALGWIHMCTAMAQRGTRVLFAMAVHSMGPLH